MRPTASLLPESSGALSDPPPCEKSPAEFDNRKLAARPDSEVVTLGLLRAMQELFRREVLRQLAQARRRMDGR